MLLLATQTFAQNTAIPSTGMAKMDKDGAFQKYEFTRHAVGDCEILIDIMYSGICHSDIHAAKGEWRPTKYPFVGGHEIAGHVVKVGKAVTKFKVGDYAGIGCLVNSCGECSYCKNGQEQFCSKGPVFSYGMPDPYNSSEITQGGYANNYVIAEKFALKIPKNADLKRVAPLLCAGITTYSPIQFSKVKKGDTVAVAGFGGLGHLAVKYLVALGAKVTVFDITEDKRTAAQKMGAVKYVNVKNAHEIKGLESQYSFILSTIPQKYDPTLYIKMLSMGGELAIVGLPATENQPMINGASLVYAARRKVYGSLIGGIPETQQMLDYSVANNIYPDVEIISANQIDEAYQKVIDGKVQFRYVIDMKTLKK
ncbi:putative zinc-type alcohol dehydrogenase-like protein [Pedobacter duraquae]|uniref:Putative zinc-type alcohol dehydrogenase-like protein n=2 Tax=Pedobacter duraquae TaxID=425511 RepID=A0A4R6IKK1_9SPHI|nr:putative zinc-type alcohol dehydrogenase-like protein [Pedobacter duraquae]